MISYNIVSDCTQRGADYGIFGDYLFKIVSRNISRMAAKFHSVLSQEDVMDLTQDTWLKIIDKSSQFKADGNFEGWVYRICQNSVYDYADKCDKHRKRKCALPEDYENEKSPVFHEDRLPDFRVIQNESVAHIEGSIETLKPKHKNLVWMLVDEVPYKKMATRIGCREKTVKTQVCRVRQCLRKAM